MRIPFFIATFQDLIRFRSISSSLKKNLSTEGTGKTSEEYFSFILFSNFQIQFFKDFAINPGRGLAPTYTSPYFGRNRKGNLVSRQRSENSKEPGERISKTFVEPG